MLLYLTPADCRQVWSQSTFAAQETPLHNSGDMKDYLKWTSLSRNSAVVITDKLDLQSIETSLGF